MSNNQDSLQYAYDQLSGGFDRVIYECQTG